MSKRLDPFLKVVHQLDPAPPTGHGPVWLGRATTASTVPGRTASCARYQSSMRSSLTFFFMIPNETVTVFPSISGSYLAQSMNLPALTTSMLSTRVDDGLMPFLSCQVMHRATPECGNSRIARLHSSQSPAYRRVTGRAGWSQYETGLDARGFAAISDFGHDGNGARSLVASYLRSPTRVSNPVR